MPVSICSGNVTINLWCIVFIVINVFFNVISS